MIREPKNIQNYLSSNHESENNLFDFKNQP